uniref:Methyltransf_21 domain-containing protein n=2 Tax=Caenorhabditis tropicalis TaxID=1561998 RepID=A0A1I7TCD7_9PELO
MPRYSQYFLGVLSCYMFFLLLRFYFSDDYTDWIESNQDETDLKSVTLRGDKTEIFGLWHRCFAENMLQITDSEEFWRSFVGISRKCDSQSNVNRLGIVTLKNSDEMKQVLFPKIFNAGPHNFFTIGIGRDIRAEKQFRRKMLKLGNNVTFFGADPIPYKNGELYSQIGSYFPLAIGGKSGISNARVMEKYGYIETNMIHIDIVYFFKEILNITTIDNLWFDAEGEEFNNDFFDVFYENGRFEQNKIDVCQINIEIHITSDVANRKREFMKFLKRVIEEKRYGVFFGDAYGHIRMYMFNFSSQYCLEKF